MPRASYDAVIIGSGAGGSTLARGLTERGLRVLVVEKGAFIYPQVGRPSPSVHLREYGLRRDRLEIVGGATKFYGATLYRLRQRDFDARRLEQGESPAWPITYADLEPYYCRAERLYRVHGVADEDSDAPRSESFPHPPIDHADHIAEMVARLERTGVRVTHVPTALDVGPGGKCVLCGRCVLSACQFDGKMDAEVAALRPALDTGRADVQTRTECLEIVTAPDGLSVSGVRLLRDGEETTIHSSVVAVAAGVGGTALLLRRSRSSRHPEGLGNNAGCLGRWVTGHHGSYFFIIYSCTKEVPSAFDKTFAIHSFYEPSADWPYPTGLLEAAGARDWDRGAPYWARPFGRWITKHTIGVVHYTEAPSSRETGYRFQGDHIAGLVEPPLMSQTFLRLRRSGMALFRKAGYRVIGIKRAGLAHTVGSARMGTDPAVSVLDPTCRVHNVRGLYVTDAAALVTTGAVNPSLTIMAVALRAADTIAKIEG